MIEGQPSATALMVALSVLRHGARHRLPEASRTLAESALRQAGGAWPWLARCARWAVGRAALDAIERIALPGLAAHHCLRKRWLLQRLRDTPADARLLWLGVGYDGSGMALCQERPRIELIELDHPDSLRLRRSALEPLAYAQANAVDRCSDAQSSRIVRSALTLPDDADRLLAWCAQDLQHRHGTARPTTLIVEGVAMYLPPRALLRLLRRIAALPAPPRLLFTALAPTQRGGRGFAAERAFTRNWLARRGEPFRWRCAQARLHALLRRYGYAVGAHWDGEGFGEYAIDAVPVPRRSY